MPGPPQILQEMVIRDGQPIWRVCCGGLCVENQSGIRAHAVLKAMARSRGIELPDAPRPEVPPHVGPDPDGPYGEPGT